jgi:hypothetical protein
MAINFFIGYLTKSLNKINIRIKFYEGIYCLIIVIRI